jgi:ADP-ribosylglycohydrolase
MPMRSNCSVPTCRQATGAIVLCTRLRDERAAAPPPDGQATGVDPRSTLHWIVSILMQGQDFRAGLQRVLNQAGDTDVHGAIFGQLAGALYGAEAIPKAWRRAILRRDLLQQYADRLLVAALAPHT